jgi:[acyl-carrier-protein] S-malonyltransferase
LISTAIVCSGQGSQAANMFDLVADTPQAAAVFQASKAILDGSDPRDLVHTQTPLALHANRLGQILCCTQTMAAWAAIGDLVPNPILVAGYSVGELAAWGVAGLLDAAGVLALAVQRADTMDAATTVPSGLLAIRGLSRNILDPLCHAHGAAIAIVNAPDQMIVGGTTLALTAVAEAAEAAGAAHTTMLAVAVASHTPLLSVASQHFAEVLEHQHWPARMPPGRRLLSGIDGAPVFDIASGVAKLARQIQQTVDWAACMEACRSAGVTKVIELGPGNGLARLMRDVMQGVEIHSISEFHTLAGFRTWVAGPS